MIATEVEVAKRFFEQSIAHLDVALQQTATMIGVLRVTACAVAFNDALKNRFSELEVNELKRISSARYKLSSIPTRTWPPKTTADATIGNSNRELPNDAHTVFDGN